jgi:tetratricopeptide (TPR) repeat protein
MVVLTMLAVLLAAAIGMATNLASALVEDRWVNDHRALVLTILGVLVIADLAVAVWLVVAAHRAEATHGSAATSSQAGDVVAGGEQRVSGSTVAGGNVHQHGPVAQTGGAGAAAAAIGTLQVQGSVNIGSPAPAPAPPPATAPSGRISNLPPRNLHFTGRTDLLNQLNHTLSQPDGRPAALVAAYGLGGIGKTQLALEYAHRHRETYSLRWWIPAESPLAIAQGLALLAPQLDLPQNPDLEATTAAVRAELARREGWLLIFDNADDPVDLYHYLPAGAGHVLVTSRNPGFAALGTTIEVDRLGLDEATAFLLARTGTDERDIAERLAKALGRLPLALAQAAGYLDQTPGVTPAGYLARFERARDRLLELGTPPGYPAPVARTWLLNVEDLTRTCPAAVDLLRLCAFLAPETPIPFSLLSAKPSVLPEALRATVKGELGLDEPASALYRYSLVTSDRDGIRVHRLVQAVTRHQLGPQSSAWHARAAELVLAAFPKSPSQPEHWPQAAAVLPHALHLRMREDTAEDALPAVARLADRTGVYLHSRAELAAARQAHERAVMLFKRADGPDHPNVGRALGNLANVLSHLGDTTAARTAYERALAIFERAYGPNHHDVAGTLENLAYVRLDLGELAAARALLERALRIFETLYGPDHPEVARTLGSLGHVMGALGELAAARVLLERALRIAERTYGPGHPAVARALTNLGTVLLEFGEPSAAREVQERALGIFERTYGPDNPEVANTLTNLGAALRVLDELSAARTTLERALAIREQVFGPDHPEVAATLANLGVVLRVLKELGPARTTLERALAILEAAYGPDHPNVARALTNLGLVLGDLAELDGARTLLERSLGIVERRYGANHPVVARTLLDLGIVLHGLGKPAAAREVIERALEIFVRKLGEDHPDTRAARRALDALAD